MQVNTGHATGQRYTTSRGTEVILGERIGQGGEAGVYRTQLPKALAKIYHAGRLAQGGDHLEKKARALQARQRDLSKWARRQVCAPLQLLYGADKRFAGFTMGEVTGGKKLTSITSGLNRIHSQWGAKERLQIAYQLARVFSELHRTGVLVGDPSPNNVMVVVDQDEKPRVVLVDVDSFHLPGFPCVVKTPPYVRPTVLRKKLDWGTTVLSDSHALCVMVFEILIGVAPYAHRCGGSPSQDAENGVFPYAMNNLLTTGRLLNKAEPPNPLFTERWQALPNPRIRTLLTKALRDERPVDSLALSGELAVAL